MKSIKQIKKVSAVLMTFNASSGDTKFNFFDPMRSEKIIFEKVDFLLLLYIYRGVYKREYIYML